MMCYMNLKWPFTFPHPSCFTCIMYRPQNEKLFLQRDCRILSPKWNAKFTFSQFLLFLLFKIVLLINATIFCGWDILNFKKQKLKSESATWIIFVFLMYLKPDYKITIFSFHDIFTLYFTTKIWKIWKISGECFPEFKMGF